MKNSAAAIADYSAALAINPKKASSLYGRGLAERMQDAAAGASDISAALALQPSIAGQFKQWGIAPEEPGP